MNDVDKLRYPIGRFKRLTAPLDAKTRSVLGELLSHSDLTISRRAAGGLIQALRQRRNRAPQP